MFFAQTIIRFLHEIVIDGKKAGFVGDAYFPFVTYNEIFKNLLLWNRSFDLNEISH